MPVVPIRPAAPASAQPMPQPDPTFLAMAAAQMHGEGKFQQVSERSDRWKQENWDDTWKTVVPPDKRHLMPKDYETIEEDGNVWGRPKPAPEDLIS